MKNFRHEENVQFYCFYSDLVMVLIRLSTSLSLASWDELCQTLLQKRVVTVLSNDFSKPNVLLLR